MEDQIFIRQREEGHDPFRQMEAESLERLQGLARELWTDYNAHDPGVTIMNVLNYALLETDYRLKFDLLDYLVSSPREKVFLQQEYGLFSPLEVFPTRPVTLADYRKLIIDQVAEIEDIWIYPSRKGNKEGWYEALVELMPGTGWDCAERVRGRVRQIYNQNRNLCEGLDKVLFVKRKPLILQAEIEVETGAEIDELVLAIYWEALQFFVPGIRYRKMEDLLVGGKTLDEVLDGPNLAHWAIDNASLNAYPRSYSVPVLFHRLVNLNGIKAVRSLGFLDEDLLLDTVIESFQPEWSYTVLVPEHPGDSKLKLFVNNSEVGLDFSRLSQVLYAKQAENYGDQNRTTDMDPFMNIQHPTRREVYDHESVQNDFPECYAVGRMGVASDDTPQRKGQAKQLSGFLLLFDQVLSRGLKELCLIPQLVGMNSRPVAEGPVRMEAKEIAWDLLVDEGVVEKKNETRFMREKKNWLDMLDGMYGENSYPAWLNVLNHYNSTEEEILAQRVRFLKEIPKWGADRSLACDLSNSKPGNVPGIKAYVSMLLGFEITDERPVVNVFPLYNLKLVDDDWFYTYQGHILSHDLLPEEAIREEYMEHIPIQKTESVDWDYHVLRASLPILHYNLLFEGLFRGGILLENYRMLNLPLHPDRLLVFYHREKKKWVNLGRLSSRDDVFKTANCLRRFLEMLNRRSETLYVVEHIHIGLESEYDLTVVFPGWSVRMSDLYFRKACESLVCMRLPAHLKVGFRWLPLYEMWEFEQAYFDWRKALASGDYVKEKSEVLKKLLWHDTD